MKNEENKDIGYNQWVNKIWSESIRRNLEQQCDFVKRHCEYKYTLKDRLFDFLMLIAFAALAIVLVLLGIAALLGFALPIAALCMSGNALCLLFLIPDILIIAITLAFGKFVFYFWDKYC